MQMFLKMIYLIIIYFILKEMLILDINQRLNNTQLINFLTIVLILKIL